MLSFCLRSFALIVALASLGLSGCGNESLAGGGKKLPDGSVAGIDADPAACGCQVDGYTLTISWDCYCATHDCTRPPAATSCSEVAGTWAEGCGFQALSVETIGGLEEWVYTNAGQLIGVQLASDVGTFTCPTDARLQGYLLRAGKLALDTCEGQTPCPCLDGGVSCSTPPRRDSGTLAPPTPVDAAI